MKTRILYMPKRQHIIRDTTQKFHSNEGYFTEQQLTAPSGSKIVSSNGTAGHIFDASFADLHASVKRRAQIMIPKELSWIIGATGIGKESIVVDAGSGSGGSAIFLARFAKKVYSFDVRPEHLAVAKKNAEQLGVTNISFTEADINEGIPKKDADVVVLDVADTPKALSSAYNALKPGGFLVTYSPSITQNQQTVVAATQFFHLKTVEIIEREWAVDERRCRPAHGALGHTGFLSLFRKTQEGM